MKVQVKKLSPEAKIPQKAHKSDAGMDLTAISKRIDKLGFVEYGTGLAVAIPENHVGLIFPRSSISKINMSLTNSVGVIDSGYQGEIRFRFKPSGAGAGMYEVGDRVGQLIIMPYPEIQFEETDEFKETERGEGGFGSSDEPLKHTPVIINNDDFYTVIDGAGMVHKGTEEQILKSMEDLNDK